MIKIQDYTNVKLGNKYLRVDKDGQAKGEYNPIDWVKSNIMALKDAESGAALQIRILASMSGVLINRRVYPGEEWKKSAPFFMERPVLMHHDHHKDAVGILAKGEFEQKKSIENDWKRPQEQSLGTKLRPSGIVYVEGSITDSEIIAKALDKRVLHVSQGSRADHCACSICGADWAEDHWCDHMPGRWYDRKSRERVDAGAENADLAYSVIRGIIPVEVSFVNDPALREARIIEIMSEMTDSQQAFWDQFTSESGPADILEQDSVDQLVLVDHKGEQTILRLLDEKPTEVTTGQNHPAPKPADTKNRDAESSHGEPDMSKEWEDKFTAKSTELVDVKSRLVDAEAEKTVLVKKVEVTEARAKKAEDDLKAANDRAAQLEQDKKDLKDKHDKLLAGLKDGMVDRYVKLLKEENAELKDEEIEKAKKDLAAKPLEVVEEIVKNRETFRSKPKTPETIDSAVNGNNGTTKAPESKDSKETKDAAPVDTNDLGL